MINRVLHVDDDRDDRYMLRMALHEALSDPHLDSADSVEQMMKILRDEKTARPDLIFLDLNMPEKNGYQGLAVLKSDPDLREIPVVILTTSDDARSMERTFHGGAGLFFVKPNSLQAYKERLRFIFDNEDLLSSPAIERFIVNASPSSEHKR